MLARRHVASPPAPAGCSGASRVGYRRALSWGFPGGILYKNACTVRPSHRGSAEISVTALASRRDHDEGAGPRPQAGSGGSSSGSGSGSGGGNSGSTRSEGDARRVARVRAMSARCRSRAGVAAAQTGMVPLDSPVEPELLLSAGEPRVSDEQRVGNLRELWALLGCTTVAERRRVLTREAFGGSLAATAKAVHTRPGVLCYSMEGVNVKLEMLQRLLGGRDAALEPVCKHPQLVPINASALQRNAEHLQQLLGLEQAAPELPRLLRLQPSLLTLSPDTLRTKLRRLCEGLDMELEDVQCMCTDNIRLLTFAHKTMHAKVSAASGQCALQARDLCATHPCMRGVQRSPAGRHHTRLQGWQPLSKNPF